jgi:hypothetical protein
MEQIEAVTLEDIRRVLDRFPLTRQPVFLAYGPLDATALGLEGASTEAEETGAEEAAEAAETE